MLNCAFCPELNSTPHSTTMLDIFYVQVPSMTTPTLPTLLCTLWDGPFWTIPTGFISLLVGSFNGKPRKDTGAVWRVNSGIIISSFLSLLSLHRLASCLCQRPQLLSDNLLYRVTSLGNTLLVPSGLVVITAGGWCDSWLLHCTFLFL